MMSCIRSILTINHNSLPKRYVHVSAILNKNQAARYRPIPKVIQPLTYEMANPPHYIATRKSWNSWNTWCNSLKTAVSKYTSTNIKDGNRPSETAVEDLFIRNFISGTWHGMFVSEIIIKRQHNMIRIAGQVSRKAIPSRLYFLLGYSEELLSYWLHCPVKMEIVTVRSKRDVIYKTI